MLPVIILAGGRGTRIRPLTESLPKSLVPILGKPFLEWQLDLLEQNGVRDVTICVSYKSELINAFIRGNLSGRLKIDLVEDGDSQLGTGGAIVGALKSVGKKFMVIYGDSYLPFGIREAADFFMTSETLSLMTVIKADKVGLKGNAVYRNNLVVEYEKNTNNPSMQYLDYGLNFFQADAFKGFEKNTYIDLSQIQSSLALARQLSGVEVENRFYEIGSMQGIKELTDYLGVQNNGFH